MFCSNMDRIIALYQYRYPDTWVEDAEQVKGTFTTLKGSVLGPASPLAPFHMNALGDMWTSTTSRNWTSFGYTYPEIMSNPTNETLALTLNSLYKPVVQGLNSTNTTTPIPGNTNTTVETTDWLCEVKMPTDIQISYSVRAFLGEPDADPNNWPTDPNYVGQLASMSSPRMNSDVVVTGNIVLTEKLAQKHASGELKSLDKAEVQAYLKEHFSWRIQALDFSEIPRNNPPAGLNVTVFNVPVKIPESDTEFPTWDGDVEYNNDIEGNPPVYNGPGIDGTNFTLPSGAVGGHWNNTSHEFEWKNATDPKPTAEQETEMTIITEYVTLWPSATSTSGTVESAESVASASSAVGESEPSILTSVRTEYLTGQPSAASTPAASLVTSISPQVPEPTTYDVRTRFVTSVIMEYITVG